MAYICVACRDWAGIFATTLELDGFVGRTTSDALSKARCLCSFEKLPFGISAEIVVRSDAKKIRSGARKIGCGRCRRVPPRSAHPRSLTAEHHGVGVPAVPIIATQPNIVRQHREDVPSYCSGACFFRFSLSRSAAGWPCRSGEGRRVQCASLKGRDRDPLIVKLRYCE